MSTYSSSLCTQEENIGSRRPLTIEKRNERDPRQGNHSDRRIEMSGNESRAPSSDRTATQARRTRLHNRRE